MMHRQLRQHEYTEEQQRRKNLFLYHRYETNKELYNEPINWWVPLGVEAVVAVMMLACRVASR
jgi:hypothetical protein